MTCEDCKHFKFCMERSRLYPCREFKMSDRATTTQNKRGEVENLINYSGKFETSKTVLQSVTEVVDE